MPTSKRGVFTRILAFVASIFATTPIPAHAGATGPMPVSRQPVTAVANKQDINTAKQVSPGTDTADSLNTNLAVVSAVKPAAVNYYLSARLSSVALLNTPKTGGASNQSRRANRQEKSMPKRKPKTESAKRTIKVQPSWQRPSQHRLSRLEPRRSAAIVNLPVRNRGIARQPQLAAAA